MSYTENRSVPFELSNVNYGLQVAKGLLKLRQEGVELEFEVKDAFFGIISSGVQTVRLNYEDLESIRFEKGWFRAKIVLEATSMRTLEKLPKSEQATCTLKIKRKDREEAQNIISRARVQLSEYRLDRLNNEGD